MSEIIDFNKIKLNKDNLFNLTTEDIFNLFLIFRKKDVLLWKFDLNTLMMSLAQYKYMENFNFIFKNISVEKDVTGIEIVNLRNIIYKKTQEKLIIIDPKNNNEIYILGSNETFENLSNKYDKKILDKFNELMFYINNDLEYGINNWELFAQDEIINVPKYPSIVTGEFINQDKNDPKVKQMIKKRAIENSKNIY